jgi:hypothetical protein
VVSGEKKKKRGVIEFLSSMAKRPTLIGKKNGTNCHLRQKLPPNFYSKFKIQLHTNKTKISIKYKRGEREEP